jgi:hypothetical protein
MCRICRRAGNDSSGRSETPAKRLNLRLRQRFNGCWPPPQAYPSRRAGFFRAIQLPRGACGRGLGRRRFRRTALDLSGSGYGPHVRRRLSVRIPPLILTIILITTQTLDRRPAGVDHQCRAMNRRGVVGARLADEPASVTFRDIRHHDVASGVLAARPRSSPQLSAAASRRPRAATAVDAVDSQKRKSAPLGSASRARVMPKDVRGGPGVSALAQNAPAWPLRQWRATGAWHRRSCGNWPVGSGGVPLGRVLSF